MALQRLRVEGFRGVRAAELTFERTTVLIGENDSGLSSLLEALAFALEPAAGEVPRLSPEHFHVPADGSGRLAVWIQLTLRESHAGSWSRPELEALAPLLPAGAAKPRALVLEIAAPPPADARPVAARWRVHGAAGRESRDDLAVLAAVRRLNPLIWLRHGAFARDHDGGTGGGAAASGGDIAAVVRDHERHLHAGVPLDGAAGEPRREAARRLLEEWAPALRPRPPELRAVVAEVLAHGVPPAPAVAPDLEQAGRTTPTGSAAQRFGQVLVAAQVVRELQRTGYARARPILVVEQPEAHLHPMTLASIWSLLAAFPAQKIVTTHSGTVLSAAPLHSVRRLVRAPDGAVRERRVGRDGLTRDELRKVGYHLRMRRSVACFARVWLLVEGQTEFWVLPDLARLCGYDLAQEGVACVEFAQSGLVPLIKVADKLGIEWHVLTDGDRAGHGYAETALRHARGASAEGRLTRLREHDIEHCFWHHGYAEVFERLAGVPPGAAVKPSRVIHRALDEHSKPGVAFELLAAVATRGAVGPPPPLRRAIEACVQLARDPSAPRREAVVDAAPRPAATAP